MKRQVDKAVSDYDQYSTANALGRTTFEIKAQIAMRVVLYGVYAFMMWSYFRVPLFYLHPAWTFSDFISDALAFPFAPQGVLRSHRLCYWE